MNAERVRELGELADALDGLSREYGGALEREPTVRHPLDDAVKEARRRFNCVQDKLQPTEE